MRWPSRHPDRGDLESRVGLLRLSVGQDQESKALRGILLRYWGGWVDQPALVVQAIGEVVEASGR